MLKGFAGVPLGPFLLREPLRHLPFGQQHPDLIDTCNKKEEIMIEL